MSNGVKHSVTGEHRGWTATVIGSAALTVLACALPMPPTFGDLLRRGAAQTAAGGPAGAAVLVAASCVIWPLLTWGCSVLLLGAATRLPGGVGRSAGKALRRVIPAALRPILIGGLGVSIAVGTVACGTGGSTAADPTTAPAGRARVAAQEGGAAHRDDAGPARAVLQLDWPSAPVTARIMDATVLPELDWPVTSAPAAVTPRPSGRDARAHRPTSSPTAAYRPDSPGAGSRGADSRGTGSPRAPTATDPTAVGDPVVVRPGDSLWTIAVAHLPAGSDEAQVGRHWRAWYARNASVIGPDPNLILPGQHLLPPTTKDAP